MILQINVVFDTGAYEMSAEIQIHLRPLHIIKQKLHLPYEIERAKKLEDVTGHKAAPAASADNKAELEEENARLRREIEQLRQGRSPGAQEASRGETSVLGGASEAEPQVLPGLVGVYLPFLSLISCVATYPSGYC